MWYVCEAGLTLRLSVEMEMLAAVFLGLRPADIVWEPHLRLFTAGLSSTPSLGLVTSL
ncbi:hypothetical protein DPMN_178109 [Dreissena polymorpha]|uniref:Uncharacterized protein n=1 Tax=Dreissena polymorpha TaxID=45954 RepID=A0A9D4EBJ1_DREPO|nr:hypothetical protein DPMN_178109 [Dreissena polymorpha]